MTDRFTTGQKTSDADEALDASGAPRLRSALWLPLFDALADPLEVARAAWSGEPVRHRGEHYTVDDIRFLPRPVQRPTIPIWTAGYAGKPRPLRRAVRYDGYFPAEIEHADQLAEVVAAITDLRRHSTGPYDIAVALPPGTDDADIGRYAKAGATRWLTDLPPETVSLDQVRGVLRDGPAR
jgi:alkanesulfonate monooxygenase SsuD/methylene tetrahydromethanopterin reductase-like flavin-dependent oxidoreductase (luciferase family)